jgi:hypothetical protein
MLMEIQNLTEKIVSDYTGWNRLEYYSCGRETYKKVNRNDILVIADHKDRWLIANRIKSKTEAS